MKKFITIMSIISLMATTSCTNEGAAQSNQSTQETTTFSLSLQDKSIQLASDIGTLANDKIFIDALQTNDEGYVIADLIASQDLSNPTSIYKLGGIDKSYKTIMEYVGYEIPKFENSKIEEIYKDKIISTLPDIINSTASSTALAMSYNLNVEDVFLYPELTEREFYLLLFDGYFNVLVSYTPKEEGIVIASASIVTHEMLTEIQTNGDIDSKVKLGISFAGISLEKLL